MPVETLDAKPRPSAARRPAPRFLLAPRLILRARDRGNACGRSDAPVAPPESAAAGPTCLVVFVGNTQVPWLRLLRPGFRHCFVALVRRDRWLVLDSLKGHVETDVLPVPADFPLARFYGARGLRVVAPAPAPEALATRLRLGPLTCVELTKRLVGLAAPAVVTPWQLYRALLARGGRELSAEDEFLAAGMSAPALTTES